MTKSEFITFGCRLNAYETEVMRDHANAAGIDDAVFVNTCAVTNEAVRQARQTIRKSHRTNPDKKIIVTGCAAQIDPDMFSDMEEVARVIGNNEKMLPATYTSLSTDNSERVIVDDINSVKETAGHLIDGLGARTRAYVQVQNGCDHRCTFCIIPYGRGPSRSVPAGEVVGQIKRLLDKGYLEIVITGVDITSYGSDLPGTQTLGTLIQSILTHVPDLPRLRLSSIDSIEVDEALFDAIATEKRFMPHLHLSLQAGDDMTLKRMKRRHLRDDAIEFCDRARAKRPEIVFGADLIAGFPTESDEMFENTVALIDECHLTYLHVFPFSPRPGTPAARMPQVDPKIAKARAARLRAHGETRYKHLQQSLLGQKTEILMEHDNLGRTPQFMEIELDEKRKPGEFCPVEITSIKGKRLIGVACS